MIAGAAMTAIASLIMLVLLAGDWIEAREQKRKDRLP